MKLPKYSMGVGDRFGHQAQAQLKACIDAQQQGLSICPVWNKSHREHSIINSSPQDTRQQVDLAVKSLNWTNPYFLDADHINLNNVSSFITPCDFFTLDIAEYISKPSSPAALSKFIKDNEQWIGQLTIPSIDQPFEVTKEWLIDFGNQYLLAIDQAEKIYQHIAQLKPDGQYIIEVSMDETNTPQSPLELFFILASLAKRNIPAQTIAPKFTGQFYKGIDYVGDTAMFQKEFEQDLAVIKFACSQFNLPDNLKLSVHSGSDKFSIYPIINQAIRQTDSGIHIKTAGTTWLEEVIGLALASKESLQLVKDIYRQALIHYDKLCQPYATVIDIDKTKLPTPEAVDLWDAQSFSYTLRHNQSCPMYNLHFRQLMHLAYKIAADLKDTYISALEQHEPVIAEQVYENILNRHLLPIFSNNTN